MSVPIIQGLEVEPGSQGRGFLEAGPYFDNRAGTIEKIRKFVRIPFNVIRGLNEGPTLLITAGAHPTEYAGIDAAIRLSKEVKPKDLNGKIIIVPVINVLGFWERSYICPIDGVNVHTSYAHGGKKDGTIGEMIGYQVAKELISKADYHLDLHGPDTCESGLQFSNFVKSGDSRIDDKAEGMARALGIELSEYIQVRAQSPARVQCEVGQGGKLIPELSSALFEGVLNVLRYLKMIEGQPRQKEYIYIETRGKITVNHNGLFYRYVKLGDIVDEGQVLGDVKNLEGDVIETIHSPCKGVFYFMIHNPVVHVGEKIMSIGAFLE